jgi:2-polyprenyl-3-methyl-5-hydroxy-6-metoxy-1,4-benzoquinol methylase
VESVSCTLCGSNSSTLKVRQHDINLAQDERVFTIVRCNQCGLIYLNPRPSPSEIHVYYPTEYYPLEESSERKTIDRFFKRVSKWLKKRIREDFYGYPGPTSSRSRRFLRRLALYPEYWHLKWAGREIIPFRGEGRVLDVGCGPGRLLRVLRDQGWETYGVDFSPVAVEYATKKHGLNVKLGKLEEASYKGDFFDVVMFHHSLEHVYEPVETLREAHRTLKPGGLLLIMIPNAGSFEARVFGKWWVHWDVPRHLFHFNKKTMALLLEKAGFQLMKIQDGLGRSSFLGSMDYVYKHVLRVQRKHGFLVRRLASWCCLLIGHLGSGSEMKVYAEKPRTND